MNAAVEMSCGATTSIDAGSVFAALARQGGNANFAALLTMLQGPGDSAATNASAVGEEGATNEGQSSDEKSDKEEPAQEILTVMAVPITVTIPVAAVPEIVTTEVARASGEVKVGLSVDAAPKRPVSREQHCQADAHTFSAIPATVQTTNDGESTKTPETAAVSSTARELMAPSPRESGQRAEKPSEGQKSSDAAANVTNEAEVVDAPVPVDSDLARVIAAATKNDRSSESKKGEYISDSQVPEKQVEPNGNAELESTSVQAMSNRADGGLDPTVKKEAVATREVTKRPAARAEESLKSGTEMRLKTQQAEPTRVFHSSQDSAVGEKWVEKQEGVTEVVAASTEGSLVESASPSRVAFHVDRLAERLGGTEFQFGYRANEAGGLQVTTRIHEQTVELGIAAERTETVTALTLELPALDAQLREHSLHLGNTQIVASHGLTAEMGMNWQHRGQREWKMPPMTGGHPAGTERSEEVLLWNKIQSSGGLSLLA